MLRFKSMYNYLVNTIIAALMGFSLIHTLAKSLNFTYNPYLLLLIVFFAVNVFYVVFLNRFTLRISYILTALCIASGGVLIYKNGLIAKIPGFINGFINWFVLYVNWEAKINKTFSYIILVFLVFSISLFVFYFTCKRFNFFVILISSLAIFISQWILNVFVNFNSFYIFLFVIPLYYLKHIYITNSINESSDYMPSGAFIAWSVPFCAVVAALALVLPYSPKPIEWKWMDEKVVKVHNYFFRKYNTLTTGDYFSLGSSGFGAGSSLGGKVRLDKTKVLKVDSPRQIYLKAIARDLYTGSSWINSIERVSSLGNPENKNSIDLNETLTRFYRFEGLNRNRNNLDKYFYRDKVKVSFLDLRTKSLFAAAKAYRIQLDSNSEKILVDSTGSLFCDRKLGNGFSYTFEAYTPKYSDPDFINILKNSKKGYYLDKLSSDISRWELVYSTPLIEKNTDGITYNINNDLLNQVNNVYLNQLVSTFENVNEIYSRYLQLPGELPPRVGELAGAITAAHSSDYEKVKAIEEYLSSNYPYTLTPEKTPKNRDFVDFFLFDGKQGYCSYFASAMTVLSRSVGIPARYVEGYVLPPKPVSSSTYEVTNEQAHAWVEVYFEGYGWLPFGPTSPFRSSFYSSQEYQGNYDPSMNTDPYYLQYLARLKGYDSDFDPSELEALDEVTENKWLRYVIISLSAVILTILCFAAIIVYNHLRVRLTQKKLKSAAPKDAILSSYEYYLKLITFNEININPGETPIEYAARVDRFILFRPVKFKTVTDTFIKARYSLNSPSDSEKELVLHFHESIITVTKSHLGKLRFFVLRYLLGKI